jgi:hypothetical protein
MYGIFILKMEASRSSRALATIYETLWCLNPEVKGNYVMYDISTLKMEGESSPGT